MSWWKEKLQERWNKLMERNKNDNKANSKKPRTHLPSSVFPPRHTSDFYCIGDFQNSWTETRYTSMPGKLKTRRGIRLSLVYHRGRIEKGNIAETLQGVWEEREIEGVEGERKMWLVEGKGGPEDLLIIKLVELKRDWGKRGCRKRDWRKRDWG